MDPRYRLASTLNVQEQVLSIYKKTLISASRNYATSKRKGFTFGQATLIQAVSANNGMCDLTDMSLGRRCRPPAEEGSEDAMCKGQWTAMSEISPEDEPKLNVLEVPSNPLLVDAIPRRWQRNDRQWIGSKRRALANTGSPGLI